MRGDEQTVNINSAADMFADDGEVSEELADVGEEPQGERRKPGRPKKRGQAPTLANIGKAKAPQLPGRMGRGSPSLAMPKEATVATRPLPDWMRDPSLLPKKPPGR